MNIIAITIAVLSGIFCLFTGIFNFTQDNCVGGGICLFLSLINFFNALTLII